MTIYDIIAKAEALRKETALGAISPERVGLIQTETLKYLNEAQIFADSLVHKIYANETAFLNDSERISDLTGRPMVAGQLLFIQNPGQFWRYDGDDRRTLIGDSIYKSDWLANEGEAGYVKNRTHYFRRSDLYTVPNTGRGAFAEVLHLNDYTKIYHASLNRIIDISYDGQEHIVSSDPYFAYKVVDGGYLYVSSDIVTSLAIVLSVTKLSEHYIPDTIARTDALDSLEEKVELVDENLQTQLESHDVAIEDLQDNKVDKGDYAPALTAGFADNLVSKDVVVDSEFNLRRSGGGAISDGVARMEVVKGNSVVWNQKLKYALSQAGMGEQGWWSRYGEAQMEGRKVTFAGREGASPFISQACDIVKGHAYLIVFDFSAEYTDAYGRAYRFLFSDNAYGNATQHITAPEDGLTNGHRVHFLTANNNYSYCIFRIISDGLSSIPASTATLENYQLIDLTQMFGAGNEPTTIEEFYARKPIVEDEYAYNEGVVVHCNVDAVKSVGRNVWDEEWEVGAIGNGEPIINDNAIRSKNFCPCLPNALYYVGIANSTMDSRYYLNMFFYDKEKKYISSTHANKQTITIPNNAEFFKISSNTSTYVYGSTYNHDICINLSDPDFNGQYEPYKEDVRELPSAIKEVFPNGMMSAGTAHDVAYNDLNKEVGVTEKRIGVVDMGTLEWQYALSGSTTNLMFVDMSEVKMGGSVNCARFAASPATENWSMLADGSICVHASRQRVVVKNPGYTDATAFKAAMAGVMLYYELAEPIVTEHQEPFNLDYQVTNGGQEQAMATEPTSAFKAEIAYGFNASAKIKENANEIAQLKATIAQLQAALASMVNANVEDYE